MSNGQDCLSEALDALHQQSPYSDYQGIDYALTRRMDRGVEGRQPARPGTEQIAQGPAPLRTAASNERPRGTDSPESQDSDETWDSSESGSSEPEPRWPLTDFMTNSTLRQRAQINSMTAPPSYQQGRAEPAVQHTGTSPVQMEVLSYGNNMAFFYRPCVDCGANTGSFCDLARQKLAYRINDGPTDKAPRYAPTVTA